MSLQKGYAIDWSQVRLVWSSRFITDVQAFEELLSSCPDPRSCLAAVQAKNLCILIERGSKTLWEFVVLFADRAQANHDLLDSPFFSAAWKLTLENTNVPQEAIPTRLELFLWASKYAAPLRVDAKTMSAIQAELVDVTNELLEAYDGARLRTLDHTAAVLCSLWCFNFRTLLRLGCHIVDDFDSSSGRPLRVPYIVAMFLVSGRGMVDERGWSAYEGSVLRDLSSLFYHGVSGDHGLDWLSDPFWFRHVQRAVSPALTLPVPALPKGFRLGSRILRLGTANGLSLSWQRMVLYDPDPLSLEPLVSVEDVLMSQLKDAVVEAPWSRLQPLATLPCAVRARAVEILKKRSGWDDAQDHEWDAEKGFQKQRDFRMRFLRKLFKDAKVTEHNAQILKFYTELTMATAEERKLAGSDEDPLKGLNPSDPARFDLGRSGAFSGYCLLIGVFYTWDKFHENYKARFESIIESELRQGLGFTVKIVYSEKEFEKELVPENYHVAYVISSNSVDWLRRNDYKLELSDWLQFTGACERFHRAGRGLFIFAEQEPLFDHANCILKRITGGELAGELPGDGELVLTGYGICEVQGCSMRFAEQRQSPAHRRCADHEGRADVVVDASKSYGSFEMNPITGSLNSLFEGTTICYSKTKGLLVDFAKSSDPKHASCLFFATPNDDSSVPKSKATLAPRAGRIVVDTGFTKLWVEFQSEKGKGTDRYIRNATVWLLGLDYRLDHQLSLTHPLESVAPPGSDKWVLQQPPLDTSMMLDIIFCIDGSGSVGSKDFEKAKSSVLAVADSIEFGLCRASVLQFSHVVSPQRVHLTPDRGTFMSETRSVTFESGGTNFNVAFQGVLQEWRENGRRGRNGLPLGKFILVFQTDGDDDSSYKATLDELRRLQCVIVTVGVGRGVEKKVLKDISSINPGGRYVDVDDYESLPKILRSTMKEFTALSSKYK